MKQHFDYSTLVDELIELERRNCEGELEASQRSKRDALIQRLFVLPRSLVEQRQYLRLDVEQRAELRTPEYDPQARVLSIGSGGMFIATEHDLKPGKTIEVVVHFPRQEELALRFEAKVCWLSEKIPQSDRPKGAGVRFAGLSSEQQRVILDLLRRHLHQHLNRLVDRYRFFFRHSPDLALLLDQQGRITESNSRAAEALGRDSDALYGQALGELLVDAGQQHDLELALNSTQHQSHARIEFALPRAGGGPLVLEALLTRVKTPNLDLGTLLVGRDLSPRIELERQRQVLERRLFVADKMASLGQIAASIAHDLNNPLAWVMNNVSMLAERQALIEQALRATDPNSEPVSEDLAEPMIALAKELPELLRDTLEGLRRMRDIVADLKTFSRLDDAVGETLDLNSVIESCLRIARNQIEQQACLRVDFGELPPAVLSYGKVCQIVLNLLANAGHAFESADRARNWVALRTRAENGRLEIEVEDNGRGVPPELLERLFDPFVSTRVEQGGTGLGLAIVKDAAASLGGDVCCHSALGEGSRFLVCLPQIAAATESPQPAPGSEIRAERQTVLVVDDEPSLLKALRRSLGRRWRVLVAESVEQALELIASQPVDVILSDMMLPGQSGVDFYALLERSQPQLCSRLVFMTGGTFNLREREFLEQRDLPVLEKPFRPELLEQTLRMYSREGREAKTGKVSAAP